MSTWLLFAALLAVTADAPVDNAALADQVAQAVRQFDAPQLAQRDDAERKLLELGPAALPLLPPITDRTGAETASRITRVQQKLLKEQAAAAAQPTVVSLKGQNLPLADVLEAISKQTGNPITDYRKTFGEEPNAVTVTIDFDKMPFWRALDQVLDQVGLTLYPFSGQRGAFVVTQPPGAAARTTKTVYAGLMRLEPVRFEAVRDLRNAEMTSLKFYMDVAWEPRLQPFAILQPLSTVVAKGSSGESIAVGSAEAEPEATIREGTSAVELEVPLALPPRGVKTIGVLQGRLLVMLPGPLEDFRFEGLQPASKGTAPRRVEQRKAGTMVTVDQLRKNNEVWEISLRVKFEAPSGALESHRAWMLENEAFFVNAKGEKVQPGGLEQSRQNKDEMGINYFFELGEDPRKLTFVYRTPITILEMPVEYEFHDLPLP